MPVTTTTVTGTVLRPTGNAWAGGVVTFQLVTGTFDGTDQVPSRTETVKCADNGTFSVDLWPNHLGEIGSYYTCRLPDGDSFSFAITSDMAATLTLSYLRTLGLVEGTDQYLTVLDVIQPYLDDAADATADAITATTAANVATAAALAAASSLLVLQGQIRAGLCTVGDNVFPPGFYISDATTIESLRAWINTAPTGADLIVRFNYVRAGVTTVISTVTITAATTSATTTGLSVALVAGDLITCDITQVGSSVKGSDLNVAVMRVAA